jgi:hypothetical protein
MIPMGAEGATSAGDGISITPGSATSTDSVINSNPVKSTGIALGGGIWALSSTRNLPNCTVSGNMPRRSATPPIRRIFTAAYNP